MTPLTLHVELECELPDNVEVGKGTALFLSGVCFCPDAPIRELEFTIDGERQPAMAFGMPRLDPLRAMHPAIDPFASRKLTADPSSVEDPHLLSYRSGFWGFVRIARGHPPGPLELGLCARVPSGAEVLATLATVQVTVAATPRGCSWPQATGPRVAICMATHNPPLDLLRRQLSSIQAQTHRNWVCLISDDCSRPESRRDLEREIEHDDRFTLSRSPRRLGFYRNFERALGLAPPDAEYVALADQDDVWREDKLETLLAEIGEAQLVYSDARVVTRHGELISETWWNQRRNNHRDLLSLLVANSVTGAASLFRRDLLEYALPFPPAQFAHFHDHWVGLVALSVGQVEYLDRPLYDYVQHGQASLGHAAANRMTSLRDRLRSQRRLTERVRMWRLHYFVDACRLLQFATILTMRCGDAMEPRKRRALGSFMRGEHSISQLARLGLRGIRELIGTPETLGAEWMLFHAFAWRRVLTLTTTDRPRRGFRLDALPPPSLIMQPGHRELDEGARLVSEKIEPLRWAAAEDAPERINLLIPTIDLRHFFGGYIAKLNLARRLLESGTRVRLVTVDPVGWLPAGWRRTVESYSGLAGIFDQLEVAFGREASAIEISRNDRFIATTWWTAHIASHALQTVDTERFLYLIQEYEPFTFPMGTYAALAAQSYTFPHFALFSSELLRGYFRAHGIGVYAAGSSAGEEASVSFQNAITPIVRPTVKELSGRETRKLLFYARPEAHAARNMFELGVLALARALEEGTFADRWLLRGIGTVERGKQIALGGGEYLDLLPRTGQHEYAELLREHDLGLALMHTPHPSLVPIEMAAGGMVTVTNGFENKTPEAMAAISSNLITADPTIDSIAEALRRAAAGVSDFESRVSGSEVRWATDWDTAFDEKLLARIRALLQSS
jgi:glycosyltransferase involved in cell wall biosynthesis